MSGIAAVVNDPDMYSSLSPEQAAVSDAGPVTFIRTLGHRGSGHVGVHGTTADIGTETFGYPAKAETSDAEKEQQAIARAKWLSALIQVHNATSPDEQKHQPPYIADLVAVAISGTLTCTEVLEQRLKDYGISTEALSGPEMLAHALGHLVLNEGMTLPDAVKETFAVLKGPYAFATINTRAEKPTIVGVRGREGTRPLVIGSTVLGFAIASETKGLQKLGAKYLRSVRPGEMVELNGVEKSTRLAKHEERLDGFEAIYFADPDSELEGTKIRDIRKAFGRQLAVEYLEQLEKEGMAFDGRNKVVVRPPKTANPYADGFAQELGLPIADKVILKNANIGRSSLEATQEGRDKAREQKYAFDEEYLQEIANKDVFLVDDSLIGSGTAKDLVAMLKNAGAKSVTVVIGSPPVRYPNYSGMDARRQDRLAAANMTLEELRDLIGCERVGFLSVKGTHAAMRAATGKRSNLDLSFSHRRYSYPISDEQRSSLRRPARMRRGLRFSLPRKAA